MGLERQSLSDHMVERTFQPPFRNLCAVKQFQRTGSGITGIGERLLLISRPFFVQTVKCRVWHIDFTPDFKFFRIVSAFQGLRYIADFLNVGRNIIAHLSVASGKSPHKAPLAVGQANCSAVELEFAGIGEILPGQKPGCPVGKIHDLTYVVGIAKGEHLILVGILLEFFLNRRIQVTSDPMGGGVGRVEFRIFALQGFEFLHQKVEIPVTDGGGIFHIIPPVGFVYYPPQLNYPVICLCLFHFHQTRPFNYGQCNLQI